MKYHFQIKIIWYPFLITNNHIINKELLYKKDEIISVKIKEDDDLKKINLNGRMKYTDEDYDVTIIEIQEKDDIKNYNYLELDDLIMDDIINKNNTNNEYLDKTVYIIQYPKGELSVSYGVLERIYEDKKYNFKHKYSTERGSSGSPILNLNNKVIAFHKEAYSNKYNKGTFLNYPIKEFIELNYKKNDKKNEVNESLLKEFNKKYNKDIKKSIIEKIDIKEENIGNQGLKDLTKIEFNDLIELNLEYNNISDIKVLEQAKFYKLEILNLTKNVIKDISSLENVKFKNLKKLYLNANGISEIKVLAKVKFEKLEILDLSYNAIDDINILEKVNFK